MNDKGSLEFLWNHGVMSDEMWANINEHCSFGPSDGVLCDEAKSPFDPLPGYDPCIEFYVPNYFNRLEVQNAVHARINTPWSTCA
ncbi:putative serine carboxypeptidase-like 30 [Setaria viridis]|uniref:putative serine carboxypeptidase-like 30 n=1 Tax=Setaria viridis TaxID=4556 RepID=UPI003B3A8057